MEIGTGEILEEYLWNSVQCARLVQRNEERAKEVLLLNETKCLYIPKQMWDTIVLCEPKVPKEDVL